jgi:putative Holliday junction resolvase
VLPGLRTSDLGHNAVRGCYGESGMAVALGLDVGERRIGIARSDGWGLLATPATTLLRTSDREAVAAIGRLAGEAGATVLVVGLPLGEGGEMTAQAQRVAAFGAKLRALPGVEVVFWDERFSTVEAGDRLRASEAGGTAAAPGGQTARRSGRRPVPGARRREAARRRVDAAAAAVILQEFLDQRGQQHRRLQGRLQDAPPGDPREGW